MNKKSFIPVNKNVFKSQPLLVISKKVLLNQQNTFDGFNKHFLVRTKILLDKKKFFLTGYNNETIMSVKLIYFNQKFVIILLKLILR